MKMRDSVAWLGCVKLRSGSNRSLALPSRPMPLSGFAVKSADIEIT